MMTATAWLRSAAGRCPARSSRSGRVGVAGWSCVNTELMKQFISSQLGSSIYMSMTRQRRYISIPELRAHPIPACESRQNAAASEQSSREVRSIETGVYWA
jgi:hypothetical protein